MKIFEKKNKTTFYVVIYWQLHQNKIFLFSLNTNFVITVLVLLFQQQQKKKLKRRFALLTRRLLNNFRTDERKAYHNKRSAAIYIYV